MTRGLFASAQAGTCGTSISFMAGCELRNTCEIGPSRWNSSRRSHISTSAISFGAGAEQRRLGMELLEIAADRDRFGDDRAVVELERRHALQRVDRGIGGDLCASLPEIDLLGRHRDALFGQEHLDPPGIGRPAAVIKLHLSSFVNPGIYRALKLALKDFTRV